MHSHSHKETHNHTSSCCSSNSCCSSTVAGNSQKVSDDSHTHEHGSVKKHTDDDEGTHRHSGECHSTHDHAANDHSGRDHKHGNSCGLTANISNEVEPTQAAGQRFSWIIRGMDCPSCANKIETAVRQISEVKQAKVLFATEKLVVDANTDISTAVRSTVEAGYELLEVGGNSAAGIAPPQSLLND